MEYADVGRKAIFFGTDVAKFDTLFVLLLLSINQPRLSNIGSSFVSSSKLVVRSEKF